MVRQNYIRRVGACIACLVLIINLVCTSYTRVEAAPVAGYAIEEVVAALLASLGITGATGEALNKAGLTPESARTILNSIYASAKEFSHDTDEAIDQTIMSAIADATELGKIVFKQGSKAWDALKEWAKNVCTDIKGFAKPDTSAALESYYDMSNFYNSNPEEYSSYMRTVCYNMYNAVGVQPTNYEDAEFVFLGSYVVLFTVFTSNNEWVLYVSRPTTFEDFLNYPEYLKGMTWKDSLNVVNVTLIDPYKLSVSEYGSSSSYLYGTLGDVYLLNPADARMFQRYGTSDLAMSDAYQTVYNPAIPDTTDIVTPSNTITREKDGSIAVTGDRAIDVALPIAWPVDLTKGIVIGKDIPIENVLDNTKTDEKTDGKDDNKEEENKPPITPDLPSGAVGDNLEADLKSIFPFCIPFDLIACIKGLAADPEAPVWNIKIPMPTNYTWTITIDMSDYEGVVRIFRIGEDLLFIVGLIVITRNLIRG